MQQRAKVDIVAMQRQSLTTKRVKITLKEPRSDDGAARLKVGL
jgi:hypothetical protein